MICDTIHNRIKCQEEAVRYLEVGCEHEHVIILACCEPHATRVTHEVRTLGMVCKDCHDVDGHICKGDVREVDEAYARKHEEAHQRQVRGAGDDDLF